MAPCFETSNFKDNGNDMPLLQGPFDTPAARTLRANGDWSRVEN
jgi:hypothetical protein